MTPASAAAPVPVVNSGAPTPPAPPNTIEETGLHPDTLMQLLLKTLVTGESSGTGLADKPYCTGIHLSLADIAVGCALGYLSFRFPDIPWRDDHPNLARLSDKLEARPSFIDTRPPQ